MPLKSSSQVPDSTIIGITGQLFALQNGSRFDLEKRIAYSRHWLVLGYQRYNFSSTNFSGKSYELDGNGFTFQHKIFFNQVKEVYGNFYIAYGPLYQRFKTSFTDVNWHPEQEDGLSYYKYGGFGGSADIKRYGFDLVFGDKLLPEAPSKLKVTLDVYAGISYKHSVIQNTHPGYKDITSKKSDIGYTGFNPVYGMKLGLFLEDLKR